MKNRAQKFRLGLFLVVTSAVLLIMAGLFTSQQFFQKRDVYYISYSGVSVNGLEVGSPVKFLGIKVGSVQNIKIDPKNVNQIIIKVALKPDTPIKQDVRADIATVGITGLKTIELRGGSNQAKSIAKGGQIPAGTSMTEEITGKAEVIAEKLESVLNNLQQFTRPEKLNKIGYMADSITRTARNISELTYRADIFLGKLNDVVDANRDQIDKTIESTGQISEHLLATSELFRQTSAKINSVVESDTINQILGSARKVAMDLEKTDIKKLIYDLDNAINQTQTLISKIDRDLDRGSQDFSESMALLKSTMQNLERTSRIINNDPSVLIRGTKPARGADKNLK